jgi:hypothetical protein
MLNHRSGILDRRASICGRAPSCAVVLSAGLLTEGAGSTLRHVPGTDQRPRARSERRASRSVRSSANPTVTDPGSLALDRAALIDTTRFSPRPL